MIYCHENVIKYSENHPIEYKIEILQHYLMLWKAKLHNKYWKKELTDNVKKKIEIHIAELETLNKEILNG